MPKPTQEQLDSIKNAKTKEEAFEAYEVINDSAFEEYQAIEKPAWKAYKDWTKPKPDYSKMSKEELIKLLEERTDDQKRTN